eukprot:2354380-Amphidinium_carterae.1
MGELSQALRLAGWDVVSVDSQFVHETVANCAMLDSKQSTCWHFLREFASSRLVFFIHASIPAETFLVDADSAAEHAGWCNKFRSQASPWGLPSLSDSDRRRVQSVKSLVLHFTSVLSYFPGTHFVVDQPAGSVLFRLPCMQT